MIRGYAGGGALKQLAKAAKRAKPVAEAADPLATAVAARMTAELEAASPLMGLKRSKQLPAAYAGDTGALQQVQRQLNEAETGLQSPGRRKFVKQAASLAARQAVPDALANVVGSGVMKQALKEATSAPAIPDESIQAAIWASLRPLLSTKRKAKGAFNVDTLGKMHFNEGIVPGTIVTPQKIAESSGLPVEAIESFLKRNGLSIEDSIGDALATKHRLRMLEKGLEENGVASIHDMGEFQDIDTERISKIASDVAAKLHLKGKSLRAGQFREFSNAILPEIESQWRNINRSPGIDKLLGKHAEEMLEQTGVKSTLDDLWFGFSADSWIAEDAVLSVLDELGYRIK